MRIWSHLVFATRDGTYGRKLFYEARGYSVTDCYNQQTDNITAGGFSFANYKAQIDAGYPVLLNLAGHSIVGVGYADPNTVYLNDTWDHATHTMTWGGSYSVPPMALQVRQRRESGRLPPHKESLLATCRQELPASRQLDNHRQHGL